MNFSASIQRRKPSPGFVLLAVLVLIFLLSMLAVSLLFRSRADETAAHASGAGEQAWATAMSGIQQAIETATAAVPGSVEWMDQPSVFRDRLVTEDGADQWYFSVFSTGASGETSEVRYGLTDEASRIHLNHPGLADLTRIPRITPSLAQALRQFTGADGSLTPTNNPGFAGATDGLAVVSTEDATTILSGISSGLMLRHGPLATLDDLLLVSGFSVPLLYGEDVNMNGRLDPNEDDGDEQFPPDNHDGILDHGMAQYFTVSSWDPERTSTGKARCDLNDPDDSLPPSSLPPGLTNYVAAMRATRTRVKHPADLLGATLKTKDAQGAETVLSSGVQPENLPTVLDLFAADGDLRHEGRINIDTASATVLATLPGIDLSLAETIVSTRSGLSPERRASIAWLLQEGVMDAERFKALAPQLTATASQFGFSVLAYGVPSGRFCVVQVIIDTAQRPPQIIYLRDRTRLGLPFKPGPEKSDDTGKQSPLRAGRFRGPETGREFNRHG